MPAPDHLIPLLTALGNGGTVATADAVVAAAGGLPGQVTAPPFEAVLSALGDGGTRDVAERIVNLYGFAAPLSAVLGVDVAHTAALTGGFTAAGPGEVVVTVSGPVVNESTEAVTPELAEAIAATDPAPDTGAADEGEAFSDDDWDPSGLDEFVADPKPTPEADLMPLAAAAATIRAWAKANGVKVPARGAIPQDVRDAYNAAQGAWRPGQTTSAIVSGA